MKQAFAQGFLDAFFFPAIVLTNPYCREHDGRTASQQQLLGKEMPAGVPETKQPLGMVHHLLCQWCLKKNKKINKSWFFIPSGMLLTRSDITTE